MYPNSYRYNRYGHRRAAEQDTQPRQLEARYAGICPKCDGAIRPGQLINYQRGTPATHVQCPDTADPVSPERLVNRQRRSTTPDPSVRETLAQVTALYGTQPAAPPRFQHVELAPLDDDDEMERRQARRDDQDYRQGLADGRRYSMERKVYGAALAEAFAMQDELNRWNAGDDY